MAKIQYLKNEDVIVYPVTHERAVRDSNGVLLENKLKNLKSFDYEVVSSLPIASAQTVGKIYLIPSSKGDNTKDEYITYKSGNNYV